MTTLTEDEKTQLFSLLERIASTNEQALTLLERQTLVANTLLPLQRDAIRAHRLEYFMGANGPKQGPIKVYLAVGEGKTRKQLSETGIPGGTVRRYSAEMIAEGLLQVRETQEGEEVLEYSFVEDLTQLSQHLLALLRESTPNPST